MTTDLNDLYALWLDGKDTNPLVEIKEPFVNDAGKIYNLALGAIGSASFIESKAGAVRSNHYHKTDWHLIYVTSGLMYYYWRRVGNLTPCKRLRVPDGKAVFTPPLVEHATFFPTDTDVVTLNRFTRDHNEHEADLVRVPALITSEVCPAVMQGVKCCLPFEANRTDPLGSVCVHEGMEHESMDGRRFNF